MTQTTKTRCYSELITLPTFRERYLYLKLGGKIGDTTFGFDRWLNQKFYMSNEWKDVRNYVITRDFGRDLGIEGIDIFGTIIVHHMNPISIKDITEKNLESLLNPEYLICASLKTHNAIHYGDDSLIEEPYVERRPGDTCPWK